MKEIPPFANLATLHLSFEKTGESMGPPGRTKAVRAQVAAPDAVAMRGACPHGEHTGASSPAARFAWAMEFCHGARLRMTPARQRMLRFLAARCLPASLEMMALAVELKGFCNETTIYRTMILFKELDLVRQVGLLKKNSFFILNAPGSACHYLICRHCETVVELPCDDPVQSWAERAARAHGFESIYHELEVYGVCPRCREAKKHEVKPNKLAVR